MREARVFLTVAVSVLAACAGVEGDTTIARGGATTGDAGAVGDAGSAGDAPASTSTPSLEFQILSLAGWNGAIEETKSGTSSYGGLSTLSSYFKAARAEVPDTLVVAGADSFGVTPTLSSFFGDQPAVEAMNFLGVDVDTIGKHPFNLGIPRMRELLDIAKFRMVATNVNNASSETGGKIAAPYHIIEVGPAGARVKVAFLGIHNPDLATSIFPGKMGTMTFDEPVGPSKAAARDARAAGAHVVVGIATMDAQDEGATGVTGQLPDFVRKVDGIDVVLGRAYRGTAVSTRVNGVLIVSALQYGRQFGRVHLKVENGKLVDATGSVVEANGQAVAADPEAQRFIDGYKARLQAELGDIPAATMSSEMRNTGVMLAEHSLGNLITDALLEKYKPVGAQIAFTNGGGIRTGLPSTYEPGNKKLRRPAAQPGYAAGPPYDVVVGDIVTMLPYKNRAVVRKATGTLIWQMLEESVHEMPQQRGRFLQVAGLKFEWKLSGNPRARVQSVTLADGTPILPNNVEYTIVLNDFNNAGGDGYTMLVEATPSPVLDLITDVVVEHVKAHGVASTMEGRITTVP